MVNSIANQLPADVVLEKQLGQFATWYRLMRQEGLQIGEAFQMDINDPAMRARHVRFWNSGGYEPTTSQEVAEAILPEGNFFGIKEWLALFGNGMKFTNAQLAKVAEIPWGKDKIKKSSLGQPEFMFLGVEKLGKDKINLPLLHKIYSGAQHPKFAWDWYLDHLFAQGTCQLRWYSITIGVVQYSYSKSFGDQEAMLPPEYEVPSAPELVLGNVLYYLLNGKYLTEGVWSSTKSKAGEKDESGYRVGVQGFPDDGLSIYDWNDPPHSDVGVVASRKIL